MSAGSQDSPLARLPALQRRSIELAFFGGLSLTQIALRLNETKDSIRLAIADGMRACR
jgi:DNA-directed RNA polymerase specialized sigma24 family protein